MSNVTGGNLDFVSTLDNTDFQKKSLQDLKMIKAILELTGDTTDIQARDKAVKASIEKEIDLREELNKTISKSVVQPSGRIVSIDATDEIKAYEASLRGLESGVEIVAGLNAELEDLAFEQNRLTAAFEAGSITEAEYFSATEAVRAEQQRLVTNIEQVNQAYSHNILVQQENIVKTEQVVGSLEQEIGVLEELKITLVNLNKTKITASASELPIINRQIQETEAEIKRFGNTGKVGFDQFGDAVKQNVEKSGNYLSQGFGYIRKLAYILPGIGIAGIIGFATEPLINYISNLDILSRKLDQARANLSAFNELNKNANKDASGQLSSLTLLYNETQNVALSMEKRISAAEQLRDLFPDEFANATALAIVNGKLKVSYDELTQSIIANAKSAAALNRITEEENKILDQQFIIDKNNAIKTAEIQKALADYRTALKNESAASKAASAKGLNVFNNGGFFLTPLGKLRTDLDLINQKANRENKDPAGLIKQGNSTISFLTQFVNNITKSSTELDNANKLLGKNLENFDSVLLKATDEKQLQNIKNALQVKLNALAPGDAQIAVIRASLKKVDDLLKQYQVKATNANEINGILERRKALLNEIDAATANINAKQLTPDQAALTKVSNTFDQLIKKVKDFNSDPKNKGIKIPVSVVNSLNQSQNTAIDRQADINENNFIKQDIEKKKALYADYEAYRAKVGSKIADQEYADLLRSGKDFQEYLNTVFNSIDKSDTSGPIQERVKLLRDALNNLSEEQKVELQKLLIEFSTYSDKRLAIIQTGIDDEKILRSKGFTAQADQVAKDVKDQLQALDLANFQKLDSFKVLAENIDRLTTSEGKKQIKNLVEYASTLYAAGKISLDTFTKMLHEAQKFNDIVSDKLPQGLKEIGSAFQNIASEVSKFDEGLGKALNTIGAIVSGVGSIKTDLNNLKSPDASIFSKVSSTVGLISTAISVVSTVVDAFSNSKANAEQAAYSSQLQIKAIEEVNKGLERQLALTKQIYGPDRITGYLKQLADIKVAEADAQSKIDNRVSLSGSKSLDDLIALLNDANGKTFLNTLVDGAIKTGQAVKLEGKSIEDLQKLLDEGKLDAKTAALVQSLIDLQQQAIDTQNALNEDLLGTSFDNLTQSITALFENATTSAADFADNFQKIIQTALINSFQRNFLEKQLQGFYDDFYNLTKNAPNNVLTSEDIAKLKAEYDAIIANAGEQFKNIEAATGVTLGAQNAANNTLQGSIKASLTEATGSILAGTLNGIQLGVENTNINLGRLTSIAQENLNVALQIQINTKAIADYSAVLPDILFEMKSLNSNEDSLNTLLRSAGIPTV